MEANQSTAEMADVQEGVNSSPNHGGDQETSPVSKTTENAEVQDSEDAEVIPFHKHPRWQKRERQLKEYKQKIDELNKQVESSDYKGAVGLTQALRANPVAARILHGILSGQTPEQAVLNATREAVQSEPEDPYSEYEDPVASKFRELDELKAWKKEMEEQQNAAQEQTISQWHDDLELDFEKRLIKDGFLKEDGSAHDEKVVDIVSNAVMATILQNAKNPKIPTPAEFDQAYNNAIHVINYLKQQAGKTAIEAATNVPSVPATGSRSGVSHERKTERTQQDRLADIMNSI